MSIYVEDNKYTQEVRDELDKIANPYSDYGQYPFFPCDGLLFSPSATVAGGDTALPESAGKFFQVTFPTLVFDNDLGQNLIYELANYPSKHVFIHGVPPNFFRTYYDNRGNTETMWVSQQGGGFTTDLKSAPN